MTIDNEVAAEISKLQHGMNEHVAARWIVLKSVLAEFDEAQRARVEARAIEMAPSGNVEKFVRELLGPSEDN
jgi:hypothetical protein